MSNEKPYLEDDTLEKDYRDDGISLKQIIVGAAAAAGSIAAYKKGALKPIIKPLLEKNARSNSNASIIFNDMKKWINYTDELAPKNSIFRNSAMKNIKNTMKFEKERLTGVINSNEPIKKRASKLFSTTQRSVISDTRDDIHEYLKRVKKTQEGVLANRNLNNRSDMFDTDLLYNITDMEKAVNSYSDELIDYKKSLSGKMRKVLIDTGILEAKEAEKQLKQIGFRKATIDDVFHIVTDKNGKVHLYEKKNYNFSKSTKGSKNEDELKTARDKIEKLLNSDVTTDEGYSIKNKNGRKLKMHENNPNYKNLILDEDILIDSKLGDSSGKMIDLRTQKRSAKEFVRNMSTEWQIPIIGVNPFRMLGGNKVGLKRNKIKFGTILEDNVAPFLTGKYGNTDDFTIRNLKNDVDILKGVKEGVTIIDGDVFKVAENGYGITKMAYKEKKELIRISKWQDSGTNAFSPLELSLLRMGGINKKHFTNYRAEDGYKHKLQKLAKFFDVGYQQSGATGNDIGNIFDASNPDNFFGNLAERVIKKIKVKPYKKVEELSSFSSMVNPGAVGNNETIFAINKSHKFKNVFQKNTDKKFKSFRRFNQKEFDKYTNQYLSTMDDFENVNRKSGAAYFFAERLNQTISKVGLGLSAESTKDTKSTMLNLIGKRLAPIYLGYKAWDAINMIGEGNDDGTPGNLEQRLLKGYARVDIGFHKMADKLGVSKIAKNIAEITPGSDMIGEIPILNKLNLADTGEEREEYWKNGYDPVRKGRLWSTNSTPFVGGRIKYFKANPLRRSLADAKYSDSLYGSRKERLLNIFDKDHYDNKNYYTRPYLMTSSAFENAPFLGPLLSSTVGRVVGGPKKMHEEYWQNGAPKEIDQVRKEEMERNILTYQSLNQEQERVKKTLLDSSEQSKTFGIINKETIKRIFNIGEYKTFEGKISDSLTIGSNFLKEYDSNIKEDKSQMFTKMSRPRYAFDSSNIAGVISDSGDINVYKTNSGKMKLIDLGHGDDKLKTIKVINTEKKAPSKSHNSKVDVSLEDSIITDNMVEASMYSNPENPYSIKNAAADQFVDTANVGGIYGFAATGFITGNPKEGSTRIETSGYSRSFNKEFFDAELGGLGGDISEIFRRLVQGRRKDIKHYNPVKNRMPEWLPGDNGFINFQRGDAYSKIAYGEERLPGEGFERLNNINTDLLFKMRVGSSTMGKTKDEMINHFLNADEITDETLQRIVDTGTRVHEKVEKQLLKAGIAKDVEGKIEDKENGIVGWYDVRMNDSSSKTGEAIMDIKTIGNKGFQEIKKTGAPKDEHQRQVNWYLHNTNKKSKGYVYYINRDNPNERINIGFDYSDKLYNSSMATLNEARADVTTMLKNGTVKRGDLYKSIDKFKILADVAPFSDEYTEMNNYISSLKLDEKDTEEVKKIRNRVSEVKKPLRLYDYRFKNNDTVSERIELGKKIDNEKYMIKGTDQAIKLAGVNITKDNPNYKEAEEYLNKVLKGNANVKIKYAKDMSKRKNKDMHKSMNVVVYNNGVNINKELIKKGYAEENKEDFTAAGIDARFNTLEKGFGAAFETIAHLDTFANTKLLQVRTATEDYERKHVYNKDFKQWQNPIDDFIKPFLWTNMNRTGGVLVGAGLGFMFGGKSKYGRLLGSIVGAAAVGGAKVYKKAWEYENGQTWTPKEKREERELNEYMDKIKFVKNRRLFEYYSHKALVEDGEDVREIINMNAASGKTRKRKAKEIEDIKVRRARGEKVSLSEMKDIGVDIPLKYVMPKPIRKIIRKIEDKNVSEPEVDEIESYIQEKEEEEKKIKLKTKTENQIAAIEKRKKKSIKNKKKKYNKELGAVVDKEKDDFISDAISAINKQNTENKSTFKLSTNAMKAIDFYNKSEATMYGYDPGEEVNNMISALPKADRQYFRDFLEAPEKDRKRILEIAPNYMQRALRTAYKMETPDKESLEGYFSEHYLPGESWEGWRENYDTESMKVKIIQKQNMNLATFDKWEQDKVKADMYGESMIPNIKKKTKNYNEIKSKLNSILFNAGYNDLKYEISSSGNKNSSINFNMAESYEYKFNERLKERLRENGNL